MNNLDDLKIGLTWSEGRKCWAIVMRCDNENSFGVWYNDGYLYLYERDRKDVIEPLLVATVWDAFDLFVSWAKC